MLPGRVAVLSPHLDDAVLSLGATIATWARAGAKVTVVTVLAGDPTSSAPAGEWDRRCGFSTEGEAARARREEDARGCALVGATPVWLPYGDVDYGRRASDDEIWQRVADVVRDADLVLVPGFPLAHPDHGWLARTMLARGFPGTRVGLYAEQPYTMNRRRALGRPQLLPIVRSSVGDGATWTPLPNDRVTRRAKRRAVAAYRSQLSAVTRRPFLARRIAFYERRVGGESLVLTSTMNQRSYGGPPPGSSRASRPMRRSG